MKSIVFYSFVTLLIFAPKSLPGLELEDARKWGPSWEQDVNPYKPGLSLTWFLAGKAAYPRIPSTTQFYDFNSEVTFTEAVGKVSTPELKEEAAFNWIENSWNSVARYRAGRLWDLEMRIDAYKRVYDLRFDESFEEWDKQLKSLKQTQPAFVAKYRAWKAYSYFRWTGGWKTALLEYPDLEGVPNCRRQVANIVYSSPAPGHGYALEVQHAREAACTDAVIKGELELLDKVQRMAPLQHLIQDGVVLINHSAGYLEDLATTTVDLPAGDCAADSLDAAFCLAQQIAAARGQIRLRATGRSLVGRLENAQKKLRGTDLSFVPLADILRQWQDRIVGILSTLDEIEKRWQNLVGTAFNDAYWDEFAPANWKPNKPPQSFNIPLHHWLRSLLGSVEAHAADAALRYQVPGDLQTTYAASPGAKIASWQAYISEANQSYDAYRTHAVMALPKLSEEVDNQRVRTVTGFSKENDAKLLETNALVDRVSGGTLRAGLQNFSVAEENVRRIAGTLPERPLLETKKFLPGLLGVLGDLPTAREEGFVRVATIAGLASALAATEGKNEESQVYSDISKAMMAFGCGVTEHKKIVIGVTPGIGWAQDVFESVTGKDVDGETLDTIDRGFAMAGALSGGLLSKAKVGTKALGLLEKIFAKGVKSNASESLRVGEKIVKEGAAALPELKGWQKYFDVAERKTAEKVNEFFTAAGKAPPFKDGTMVDILMTKTEQKFARVHTEGAARSNWLAREANFKGTPDFLKKKLNLPKEPTHITSVDVKAQQRVWRGRVGKNGLGGTEGGNGAVQYYLEDLEGAIFHSTRKIEKGIP